MKKIYPRMYYKNIQSINIEDLISADIKGLILDVDNTLIDLNKNMPDGVNSWIQEAKKQGIKMCILSNSNKEEKVRKVAIDLDIPYIFFAKKPLKSGFLKAKEVLGLENKNIASIGDQIFTDVLGANLSKMISIFVEPINDKDYFITRIKRPMEKFIIKKYLKNQNKTLGGK